QLKAPSVQQALSAVSASKKVNFAGEQSIRTDVDSLSRPVSPSGPSGEFCLKSASDTSASVRSPKSSLKKSDSTRPINEVLKFDSLEDITKAAAFHPVCSVEDQQAIRAVDIHPSGNYYVIGSNSKCLRVCPYPSLSAVRSEQACKPASVLYKKSKHHYGSIYCVAWNPSGNLIATGSNDKTIKLIKFSPDFTEDNVVLGGGREKTGPKRTV
ncbi:WD repeat-containing 47-like, partial [Brachionus plicatilis]